MTKKEQEDIIIHMSEMLNATAKELARRMLNAELIFPKEELREEVTTLAEVKMRHYCRLLADEINVAILNGRKPIKG